MIVLYVHGYKKTLKYYKPDVRLFIVFFISFLPFSEIYDIISDSLFTNLHKKASKLHA